MPDLIKILDQMAYFDLKTGKKIVCGSLAVKYNLLNG
jgi:hypothetical protein